MKWKAQRANQLILSVRPKQSMQISQQISLEQLNEIVAAVFEQGPVVVRQAYSDFGCATREFADADALLGELHYVPGVGEVFRQYTLYYPEAKGYTHERRIDLKPEECNGHTFRFRQDGWGLIQLQCDFRKHPMVECRVAVNSAIRASNWSDTYPDFQSPSSWDWAVVERKAGRLVRLMRKMGKADRTMP
ncbi:MAG: hypothetical protein JNL58_28890 [Planctomyces sp.]|nr:hypothetical protein [Planctomyces sp.]